MACLPRSYAAQRVPFELWHRVFRHMPLDGILIVMQVCWLWRAVAMESDTYASDIILDRQNSSAAELFLLRLRRTASRQPTLEVSIGEPWELLRTLVMPAIEEHLPGIRSLSLKCHSADAANVLERLRRPAPRLRRLRLAFILDEHSSPILPDLPLDLLDNDAPNLPSLSLTNVEFLPGPMTRTLSGISHLHMAYFPSAQMPAWHFPSEYMWKYFPGIRALTLSGSINMSRPVYRDAQSWRTIQQLHLNLDTASAIFIPDDLPFLKMLPVIETFHPDDSPMDGLLSHIPGPLDVAIRPATLQRSEICLTDRNTRITRVFTARYREGLAFNLYNLLTLSNTRERMLSLTLSTTWEWQQLAAFGMRDENLTSLRFILDDRSDFALLGKGTLRFECPSLTSLVLRSESATAAAVMPCKDLEVFVGHALDLPHDETEGPRCSLVLENVVLLGPHELLDAHFREIRHGDLSGWSYPFTPPPEA